MKEIVPLVCSQVVFPCSPVKVINSIGIIDIDPTDDTFIMQEVTSKLKELAKITKRSGKPEQKDAIAPHKTIPPKTKEVARRLIDKKLLKTVLLVSLPHKPGIPLLWKDTSGKSQLNHSQEWRGYR
jgi:hypothetical protein